MEATHFASLLEGERGLTRTLESGAKKTIDGLLSRVNSLEGELSENDNFKNKVAVVD